MEKEMNLNVDSFKEKNNIPNEYIIDAIDNLGQSIKEAE